MMHHTQPIQYVRLEGAVQSARDAFLSDAEIVVEGVANPHYIVGYEVYRGNVPLMGTSLQESVYFTDRTAIAIYSWDELDETRNIPVVAIKAEHSTNDP